MPALPSVYPRKKGHAFACPVNREIVLRIRLSAPDAAGMSAHPDRLSELRAILRARFAPPDAPRWAAPAAIPAVADFPARPSRFSAGPTASTALASSPHP